jgi:Xaa-Pro aminopeptidase
MFSSKTYSTRRNLLKKKFKNGLMLFLGNNDASMNYTDNTYRYRQDSTFLYYFGLDTAGLAAIIDVDENKEIIFGNELTIDDIVWMGPQKTIKEKAAKIGIKNTLPLSELKTVIDKAISQKRKIHFIPQYRYDNMLFLQQLLGIDALRINEYSSKELIFAVAEQRAIKSKEEIAEIEKAIEVSYEMHVAAMRFSKPGMLEKEIAGFIEGLAYTLGAGIAFPIIFHGTAKPFTIIITIIFCKKAI